MAAGERRGGDDHGGDVVETTTRSSGDDGTGATRRASGSEGRVAIPRDTPRPALPHMFPKCYPRPFKCCPRAALPQTEPCYPKCSPRAALPQMLPQMLRYTLVALMSRAALPQMLPRAVLQMLSQSQTTAWKRRRRLGRWQLTRSCMLAGDAGRGAATMRRRRRR